MDPTFARTYNIVENILAEVVDLFKPEYIHLGGDEVSHSVWEGRKSISRKVNESGPEGYEEL